MTATQINRIAQGLDWDRERFHRLHFQNFPNILSLPYIENFVRTGVGSADMQNYLPKTNFAKVEMPRSSHFRSNNSFGADFHFKVDRMESVYDKMVLQPISFSQWKSIGKSSGKGNGLIEQLISGLLAVALGTLGALVGLRQKRYQHRKVQKQLRPLRK